MRGKEEKLCDSVLPHTCPAAPRAVVCAGLSLTLHCSKGITQKPSTGGWFEPPKQEPGMPAMPTHPGMPSAAAAAKTVFTPLYESSEPLVLLTPGRYDVNGEIVVPFSISSAELPAMESLEMESGGGVWHWIEARVDAVGWRGFMQRRRDTIGVWRRDAVKGKKELGWKDRGDDSQHFLPSSRAAACARLAVQVLAPPPPKSAPAAWLTVGDFGGEAKLTMLDGTDIVLSDDGELRCAVCVRGTAPLSKVEVRLLTKVDDTEPVPSRSHVIWQRPAAATTAATAAPAVADDADIARGRLEADGSLTLETEAAVLFRPADSPPGAVRLCCSTGQVAVSTWAGSGQAEIAHEMQLRLTAADGEQMGWNGMKVRLVRTSLCGCDAGDLALVLPARPEPWNYPLLKALLGVLLFFLGVLGFLVTLSFILPSYCQSAVAFLGLEESAAAVGMIPSKNGTSASWSGRSMLAAGTHSVRRFLGAAGRRM